MTASPGGVESRPDSATGNVAGIAVPLIAVQIAWLLHPQALGERVALLSSDLWRLQLQTWQRLLGVANEGPITAHADDARFADPAWSESIAWDWVKQGYLAYTRRLQDMIYDTPGLPGKDRRRAAFWSRQWLNAMAPTNCLLTNPVALRKAVETGGASLVRGYRNFVADAHAGSVRMTSPEDFEVGGNLATTAGAVIFRNPLVEVIHYAPTRTRVHAEPIVIVTPWINKFYVLDLTPDKSMVRYLLDQGLDVFITSWNNPDATMGSTSFDDYVADGVDAIVQAARRFTGAKRVHAVGYCIGGTALAMYMAWAERRHGAAAHPVADWTLLNTLVDFEKPGDIEVMLDEDSVGFLCSRMRQQGYLDGKQMAAAFRMLRSNSLIWHYVVHGWLYGEAPPPSDVLYWNMDTTRMPQAMHAWYLTELYLHNRLVQPDALTVAGEALDLGAIRRPLYAVAAEDDHITPWRQTFRTLNHVQSEARFVLSSSGHILAIVNPPVDPPKRRYWAGPARRADQPEPWREGAEAHVGTWWGDWMAWLKPKAGPLVRARPAATATFPELAPAPGTYVFKP